jgi:hypothetical protein
LLKTLDRLLRSNELLIFISTLLVYALTVNTLWTGDHANSIMELEYSLFSSHTFTLGKALTSNSYILGKSGVHMLDSVDIFEYNQHFYSAIAPGVAFFALPFASLGFILDGHFTFFGYASLFNELFLSFANSIAAVFVYKISRLYFSQSTSIFLSFVYAFSTFAWPLATMIFQHDLSAMFDVISAYCILSYFRAVPIDAGKGGKLGLSRPILAGLSAGLAFTVDYVSAALILVLLVYVWFCLRGKSFDLASKLKVFLGVLGATLIGIITIAYYNIEAFGHILDFSEQTYLASRGGILSHFSTPIYYGLEINILSPYRGLIFYAPFVVVGVLGLIKVFRNRGKLFDSASRRDAIFLGVLALGTIIPYSAWYDIYGGESFGPRFLVAALPFLLIPAGYFLESARSNRSSTLFKVYLVYAFGVVVNAAGAMNNALGGCTNGNYWTYVPFECSIPNLAKGELDGWWRSLPEYYWVPILIAIVAFTLILPLPWLRRMMGRG